ncbi:hypothetical protein GCM10010304_73610 [Streptomyces roseoviolaceus]
MRVRFAKARRRRSVYEARHAVEAESTASSGTGLSRPGMKSLPAPYEATVHIAANHQLLQTIAGKSRSFLAKRWFVNFFNTSIS